MIQKIFYLSSYETKLPKGHCILNIQGNFYQFPGKVAEFPTLAEQLAWCVVTQKPKDGTISKLQERATETIAGWKKKVGKGPTGSGYLASKVPPNFIEVEMFFMTFSI